MNSASKLDNGRDKSAEVSSSSSPNETRKGLSFGTRLDDRSAESAQPQRQRRLWQPPASDGHRATEKSRPGLKILKRAPRQKHTSKPLPKRTQDMKSAEQRAKEYEELKAGIWQEVETGKGGTPVNDKTKVAPAILQKFLKGRSGGNNGGQGRRGGRAHHNHHQQQQHPTLATFWGRPEYQFIALSLTRLQEYGRSCLMMMTTTTTTTKKE
mmetsp:Transcript_36725/g.59546  ORF Transcript_36725/g.59546 Transcript_36725/m.59546 type:complete len:211 (+) Transcript_36725:120-752(+)